MAVLKHEGHVARRLVDDVAVTVEAEQVVDGLVEGVVVLVGARGDVCLHGLERGVQVHGRELELRRGRVRKVGLGRVELDEEAELGDGVEGIVFVQWDGREAGLGQVGVDGIDTCGGRS